VSEWREVALRDLCDSVQYGVTASALPDRRTGTRFLRITDIVPPSIDWDSVPDCDVRAEVAEKYRVRPGDILVARTGATVGYAKYLRDPPPAVFASYLVRFQVREGTDPAYVGHVVQSDAYKQYVRANAGGAAQPNANAKTLGAFRVPLPDLKTQRRIGAVLSAFDELIEVNKRRIELLVDLAGSLYRE
jgi:type I restriction enzyme S subunit